MRTRFISLFLPAWLGCSGVVDLGPVDGAPKHNDGEDTVTEPEPEFEPALIQLAPWNWGMCGLFSDELVRCWKIEDRTAWVVSGLTGIALGGAHEDFRHEGSPSRVCAAQRSGTVMCVDSIRDLSEVSDSDLEGPPYVMFGLDESVGISVDVWDVTAVSSDGTLQIVRDCDGSYFYNPTVPPECGARAEFAVEEPIVATHSFGNFVTAGGAAYATTIEYDPAVIEQSRILPRPDYSVTFPPLRVPGIEDAVAIETSNLFGNYILRRSGTITAWGPAYVLGIGSTQGTMTSGDVEGIDDAVAMDSNGYGACAIRSDRTLWCWGSSNSNNLGFPEGQNDETGTYYGGNLFAPRRVPDLDDVRTVAMGAAFTCVGRGTNEVWCWGTQGYQRTPTHTPYRVTMR